MSGLRLLLKSIVWRCSCFGGNCAVVCRVIVDKVVVCLLWVLLMSSKEEFVARSTVNGICVC